MSTDNFRNNGERGNGIERESSSGFAGDSGIAGSGGFASIRISGKENTAPDKWEIAFSVPSGSPYFDGHFESFRILPAVGTIDIVAHCASEILGGAVRVTEIKKTKFIRPVFPGAETRMTLDFSKAGSIAFTISDQKGGKASFGLIHYSI